LRQTELFLQALQRRSPSLATETVVVSTKGDQDTETPLERLGGYGAFVRELNNALAATAIDVSVNSLKDMPVLQQGAVRIAAVLPRGPVEDVVLPCPLDELPPGAKVGSSSVRREAMLRRCRPDLEAESIRGNVTTRLRKLDEGRYDAIILARAGMERLGIRRENHVLPVDDFIPAPGQGAIAMACREGDDGTASLLEGVNHHATFREVMTERTLMEMLGADCSSPVGILASEQDGGMRVRAMSFSLSDGSCRSCDETLHFEDDDGLAAMAAKLKEAGP